MARTRSRDATPGARVLADAGPTISIAETAKVFGISRGTAYGLAKRNELGVRVLRLGCQLRVPTAELRRAVGLHQDGPRDGRWTSA